MASAAKRPCLHPGCKELLAFGTSYCGPHRKQKQHREDSRRGTASERGYTGAWQKARYHYLLAHPLCRMHEQQGRTEAATVVDHIIPHKGDKDAFWDSKNWQPLCKRCHDIKTATQDGGFGR